MTNSITDAETLEHCNEGAMKDVAPDPTMNEPVDVQISHETSCSKEKVGKLV